MPKYIKKPVEIEALQWRGDNLEEIISFIGFYPLIDETNQRIVLPTIEGNLFASVGDWIIRGIQGEIYPCKPDVFELTYDPIYDPIE